MLGRWASRRLPSEAEWEAAAAYGPTGQLESDMPAVCLGGFHRWMQQVSTDGILELSMLGPIRQVTAPSGVVR